MRLRDKIEKSRKGTIPLHDHTVHGLTGLYVVTSLHGEGSFVLQNFAGASLPDSDYANRFRNHLSALSTCHSEAGSESSDDHYDRSSRWI